MTPREIIDLIRREGRQAVPEHLGKQILAHYGISTPKSVVVQGPAQVEDAWLDLTPPLVAKVMSKDVIHKSDFGGVCLNLTSLQGLRMAVESIAERITEQGLSIDGYLIEEMATQGQEIAIGVTVTPGFGPVIMVGLGGIFIEVLADVSFRLCPVSRIDCEQMLGQLKAAPVLDGVRGRESVSREAIVDVLLAVGGENGLLSDVAGELAELDINPLVVSGTGAWAVDARFILASTKAEEMKATFEPGNLVCRFEPLFRPRTYAVVGASASKMTLANEIIRHNQNNGFDGEIYPIHPTAKSIEGIPAYPSLAATPKPIDYASIAIAAPGVTEVIAAANHRVKFAQVISSGFGETADGRDLESKLIATARQAGVRIVGPNCLGTYSPRGRVTFIAGSVIEPGPVGIISQSGGLGVDIVLRGGARGLRFSGLVTIGNSADLGPSELLSFYLADPETKVIGLYLEEIANGREFFEIVRSARAVKPIVLLKGGRTSQGRRAAASHTGALASDFRIWTGMAEQTGLTMVETLDEFLDTLLAFQVLSPRFTRPTRRVVLFGNGGGASVLASDFFGRVGLDVPLFNDAVRHELLAMRLPPGTSIDNPIDAPSTTLKVDEGRVACRILESVYRHGKPDAVVMHINLPVFVASQEQGADYVGILVDSALQITAQTASDSHFALVLRTDGLPESEARRRAERTRALALGVPVFDELPNAAIALAGISKYERFVSDHGTNQ